MKEEYRIIKDFPDYAISNLGNVRNLETSRILKPGIDKGYLRIGLYKNGEQKWFYIHRLVAEAFLPNPDNYPQVNHKDENKLNNCLENLEWCSAQYNIDYSVSKQIEQYDLNGNLIATWKSVSEVQRQFGYSQGNISKCCTGERQTAYGYVWRYV